MNMYSSTDGMAVQRLEIVVASDRLAAIEEQWTQLWHSADALIFQSHAWISAWWTTANQQHVTLRIGLIWNGDRLIAVLPFAITRRKGLRILEWAASAYTDYCDLLCAPECSDAELHKLWMLLWKGGGFDLAFINRLLPDAAAQGFIDADRGAHGTRLYPGYRLEISSRIGGWQSGAAWLASHPKKARQNYRRGLKMLEEAGTVQFRLLAPDEPLGPVLDRLAVLKRKWLDRNSLVSDFFDGEAPLLNALVDVLVKAGLLRLFVIELDGVVVAISVNFVQNDRMMAWVTTYDPDFGRASPGMVLIFDYVQWSFDHGLGVVDLLCGGETFKDRLASEVVPLRSTIGARTMKGSLALLAQGVRQKLGGRIFKKKLVEPA